MARTMVGGAALLLVAVLLLVPFHPEAPLLAFVRQVGPDTAFAHRLEWRLVETGGNFAMFALIGAAMCIVIRSPIIAVLVGCALSAAGETAQLVVPGRVASWSDLLTNCIGAVGGVLITKTVAACLSRRRTRSDRHCPAAPRADSA